MSMTATEPLSLELSRRFEAPPERVFDAWLTPAWGEWLPPGGATCEVVKLEPQVGGAYLVRMTMPDSRIVEIGGTYLEILRPQRLVLDWAGNYNNQRTVITVTFRPDRNGTLMTLRQDGFVDPGLRDGYDKGWSGPGGSFDKLAQALAAGGPQSAG
jgi:uncharacterized protein YndB with AHSA1/START domain